MKKHISILSLLLALIMVFTACGKATTDDTTANDGKTTTEVIAEGITTTESTSVTQEVTNISADNSEYFSDRDFDISYDESKSAIITLNGNSITSSSNAVQISGTTANITDEGTYIVSGTLDDGMIIVNTEKTDKVQLVLKGANINSETSAPIYILQTDKVFITTAPDTENSLSNGGTFTAIDDNNIDSVIFSKEDLTLNGSGTLTVTSPGGHGIVSKDSLTVTSGAYNITTASHGITGKDDICIANASFTITSGKDGIHAENADDTSLGYVYLQSGAYDISAEGDGISASAYMQIEGGSYSIITGGGSENSATQTSESWGGFMGGRGDKGGPGSMGMPGPMNSSSSDNSEEDSTSIKAIKSTGNLTINGGTFNIDSADDSIHSNASVTLNGGTFEIASGDDGFHADETLTVTKGTVNITESYEGLEGLHINISGGELSLVASDDGLNAAGGTDLSGIGGHRGGDMFGGMSGGSNGSITISGGKLYVNASGDGIDSNGTLEITGGYTVVCGPTQGDTATLDYDKTATISGGTFIGTGASGMAQTFSDSEQGVIAVSVGSCSAGTEIKLTDSKGNTVLNHTPELSFSVIILSSPDIVSGEEYTITVGTQSGTFEAS